MEVPGAVLPAGTYWFKLFDSPDTRNIVQIFNENWQLEATDITVAKSRPEPASRTKIQFAGRPSDRPQALFSWFYPGALRGHEFIYPHNQETRLNTYAKQEITAPPLSGSSSTATAAAG